MAILTGIIYLVVGLIACFFGSRFYRIVLALSGFVAGYHIVSGLLVGQPETSQIIGAIVGGIIGAVLFWTFYKFSQVLFGAFLGLVLATIIGNSFNLDNTIALILAIVLMIIGAVLGNAMADTMIRLGTAFAGSGQAIGGLAAITAAAGIALPLTDPTHGGANADSTAGIITLIAVVVLGIVGYLFQSRNPTEAS